MSYLGLNSINYLAKNLKFGEIIILVDKSEWQVRISDKTKTVYWQASDQIKVTQKGMLYYLTNLRKDETVEAKYLNKN